MQISRRYLGRPVYWAFAVVVAGLSVSSFIQVECPVCHGTGMMNGTPGMKDVSILSSSCELKSVIVNGCDMYLMYEYRIGVKAQNTSLQAADGWIKSELFDVDSKDILDIKYAPLAVPGVYNADIPYTKDMFYTIWYQTALEEEQHVDVRVSILNEDVADETCNGTGQIRLNTLPLVKVLKAGFEEAGRIEVPYQPPSWFIPSYE